MEKFRACELKIQNLKFYEIILRTGNGAFEQKCADEKIDGRAEKGTGGIGFQIRRKNCRTRNRIGNRNRQSRRGFFQRRVVARTTRDRAQKTSSRVGGEKGTSSREIKSG